MVQCGWRIAVDKANLLVDQFGRTIEKLRVSVTDRCNFRCTYCMPEDGVQWLPRENILCFEEIFRLVRVFNELGVKEVRLTGGEPLLRKDLPVLIEQLAILPLDKISLTTNGFFLPEQFDALYEAGIKSFNISLDTLIRERFKQITRRDFYEKVMKGLDTLNTYSDCQIKLNTVLIKDFNSDEIIDFAQLARNKNINIRFIEFMPLGKDDGWSKKVIVKGQEVIDVIEPVFPLYKVSGSQKEPAVRWKFKDTEQGELGFINSVSEPFCNSCNRMRLTADGHIRNCLFSLDEFDLKSSLRQGISDSDLKEQIKAWVYKKESGHLINQDNFVRPQRSMSQIGG